MRRSWIAFFTFALALGGASVTAYAVNCYKVQETSAQKAGDWFATFGKTGKEKKRILARRKYDRFQACVQKNLNSGPRGRRSGPHKGELREGRTIGL